MGSTHNFSAPVAVENFLDAFAEEVTEDKTAFQKMLSANNIRFDDVFRDTLSRVEKKILKARLEQAKSGRMYLMARMEQLLEKIPQISGPIQQKLADLFSAHGIRLEEAFFRKIESIPDNDIREIAAEIELLNLWHEIDPEIKD